MPAKAIALLDHDGPSGIGRWTLAAAIVLAAHVGLMASYLLFRSAEPAGSPTAPAVLVDLTPLPAAPAVQEQDLALGPDTPPPEPDVVEPPKVKEKVELLPVEKPLVALEQQPEVKPEPVKPVEKPPEKVERKKPAVRTASPKALQRSTEIARPTYGNAERSAAAANWRSSVAAHIQRYKRYPASAEARGEQGVATLTFTLSRSGQVLSRHIARSSGSSALDAEVMDMVQRAQPFPAFTPEMTELRITLTVPVRFSVR